jgi:hypothetical protein
VVEVLADGHAVVRFADGTARAVSLAVLLADDITVEPGDEVAVAIGMALHRSDRQEDQP